MTDMEIQVNSADEMVDFGAKLGACLTGGEVIELVGDIGAGKTTMTKGVARGMGIDEDVQSPTFTISRVYDAEHGLRLAHYDFYRLVDAGIMSMELDEAVHDPRTVTIIEWAEIVAGVLPKDTLVITIEAGSETSRKLTLAVGGLSSQRLVEALA